MAVAISVGLVFGYLGYRWSQRRSRFAGAIVAAAFIVEPSVYLAGAVWKSGFDVLFFRVGGYSLSAWSIGVWSVEALLGLAGTVWVVRRSRAVAG